MSTAKAKAFRPECEAMIKLFTDMDESTNREAFDDLIVKIKELKTKNDKGYIFSELDTRPGNFEDRDLWHPKLRRVRNRYMPELSKAW